MAIDVGDDGMLRRCTLPRQDSTADLCRLLERYERGQRAVPVNFRSLVPWMPVGERATHLIHPYPAKLLRQIPAFFLSSELLSKPGDTVLDPFCGSGTVLLEGMLHQRVALGADANPLARLISTVKVRDYDAEELERQLYAVLRRARRYKHAPVPPVENVNYWFYPHVIQQLAKLRRAIDAIAAPDVRAFFAVCLSVCVRRASRADPRLSVPVRLRENQYPAGHAFRESANARLRQLRRQDVLQDFAIVAGANIARARSLRAMLKDTVSASIVGTDARRLDETATQVPSLPVASVDLILTSPPYVGAQKYIRASSLSLGWLGLSEGKTLRELEDENIGREHFSARCLGPPPKTGIADADRRLLNVADINPLRAIIAATYLLEMRDALSEAVRVLKPGGHMVLVAGSNRVCGREFRTPAYLQMMLEDSGLTVRLRLVDAIRSRGLMTRRNATASVITREAVLLFQKREHADVS